VLSRPISTDEAEAIARRLRIVGQPVRIRMIDVLDQHGGELSVQQLAAEVEVNVADASQHLRVLRNDRIVKGHKRGRFVCYELVDRNALALYRSVSAYLNGQPEDDRSRPALEAAPPSGAGNGRQSAKVQAAGRARRASG
jgi:DNA-binding transcriptional ArsR family regulator